MYKAEGDTEMRPIVGTVGDIAARLEELGLPKDQQVVVNIADESVLNALKAIQSEAARRPVSDADFMQGLEINAEEFQELIGRSPER